ncbi:MAG TPA: DNA polymerase III subunit gamma/tau C-terminal domain-containing protein [Caldimonas sp.]
MRTVEVSAPALRAQTATMPTRERRSGERATREPPPWVDAPAIAEIVEPNVPAAPIATELGDRWAEVVQRMIAASSIVALVRELALQAQCVAIDEVAPVPVWRLRVERETLRAPAQCEKLQAALSELLGRAVRIEIEAGVADDTPARRDAAERARRQAEAEQTIQNDPLVQALMAQYKTARIVPGSVKSL